MYGYDDISGYGDEIVPVGYEDDDDEMGYEDLVGDDLVGDDVDDLLEALEGEFDDDEIGARRAYSRSRYRRSPSRSRYRSRSRSRYSRSRPRRRFGLVRQRQTQARRYPLGLGSTALAANATAVITVNPQLPFKLMRLSTPSTNVTVDNIQIGTVSQFVAAGGIPSEVFAPNAIAVDLKGDTAVPGVQIQITVTDTSGAANTFTGAFFGLVAQ